jgi:hypothetical protein
MILSDVSRIGKRTLDTTLGTVTLVNRTNNTTYKLSPEGLERWIKYMAFGNERQGGGGKDTFVRLSGVFPTAKGNLIGRISIDAFNAVFELMTEAQKIGGTVNIIISKNKNTGKPEMYGVVGQPFNKGEQKPQAPAGPFGQFSPAPQQVTAPAPAPAAALPFTSAAAAPSREVTFGQADVPKDDFDSLLETLR